MKKTLLGLVLLSLVNLVASENNGLNNEQKVHKTLAHVEGSTFRHRGLSIEECNKFSSELELKACKEGFEKTDNMYKSR